MPESPSLNPLTAAEAIRDSYERYLLSRHAPRDARLRNDFRAALEGDFALTRGPLLQASPPFEQGASLTDLVHEEILHDGFLELDSDAFPTERPLYRHQEEAIRKAVSGRNLIVATGTGSGKTECYLFPIFDQLFRERAAGTLDAPGVRAMLLYPMNALANDQIKRLRDVLRCFPEIAFGRFVGDTKDTFRKAVEIHRERFGANPLPNELISRDRIRECPPHILLTNYAMLEYLLLRPADTSLFDGPTGRHWRFIVLDEVHVYSGAQGAEIAMLLRRVRDRVNGSEKGRIQYMGTSATLGQSERDYPRLAEFARTLFDEEVEYSEADPARRDIISPKHQKLRQAAPSWEAEPEDFEAVLAGLSRGTVPGDLFELLASRGAPESGPGESALDRLASMLRTERHVVGLQELLASEAVDAIEVARRLFGGSTGHGQHLVALVDVCSRIRSPATRAPLVPARYHYFVRALEGAFVCCSPEHPDGQPRLRLNRYEHCPACAESAGGSRMFESGVCMKCGASYLLGSTEDDDEGNTLLGWAGPHDSDLRYLLVSAEGTGDEPDDEDEQAVVPDEEAETDIDRRRLCTRCGSLTEGHEVSCACGPRLAIDVAVAHPARRGQPLRRCVACTGRSNGPIVLRFLTGQDAPVAVVATALYQALPASREPGASGRIGGGRRLLSFSDSRQDAAFFAPYLSRTYSQAVQRRLIWMTAERLAEEHPRFGDLVDPIRREAERHLVLDEDDGSMHNRTEVRTWLMREILAVDRRQSLDGVALAEIGLTLPRGVDVPQPLRELGFTEEEALNLARVLLETLRLQASVHLPEGVEIDRPEFAPRNVVTNVRYEESDRRILAWIPGSGLNRRLDYLQKLLERRSAEGDPLDLLRDIWTRWLTAPGYSWSRILRPVNHRRHGLMHAIDPERIVIRPASEAEPPYRCDACLQVWWLSVGGVCPSYRCPGTLQPAFASPSDHYRHLYTSLQPIGMRVEEHTGQLATDYAAELQQQFVDGDVNVLSCSTTFELGVDVGEVQAILMRNVPPSPANYVQRAGRAGRRTGSAAFSVTFAQRRSHDLHYFRNPVDLVEGRLGVPIVSLLNPWIVRRHVHAVAFAEFERTQVAEGGEWHRTVDSFFMAPDAEEVAPVRRFVEWLRTHPIELGDAICRIVPRRVSATIGAEDWNWVEALAESSDTNVEYGWLRRAEEEVVADLTGISEELDDVELQINRSRSAGESARAERLSGRQRGLLRVERTLRARRLIDYLAQRVVLPKYGFPVDVVSLDARGSGDSQAERLELTRDLRLGITEFAPGSRVVADGALWETAGLRIPPGLGLPTHNWAVCAGCGVFRTGLGEGPGECTNCSDSARRSDSGRFVIPMFGFIGRQCRERPGESRPPRAGSSDFHFSDYMADPPVFETVPCGRREVSVRTSPQGQITVINRGPAGRGFRICFTCGHAEAAPVPGAILATGHTRPGSGRDCSGALAHRHLGHQYLTDVVEVQLPVPMATPQARSTLYALLESASAIGISRNDVNGTLRPSGHTGGVNLVLFDAVPGGAGHAARIAERFPELLQAALRVIEHCECGKDASCYGCLRSYANQRYHDELTRGGALAVLSGF